MTILGAGEKGAEQLLNHGDAWLLDPGITGRQRIQVGLITKKDFEPIIKQTVSNGYDKNHHLIRPKDNVVELKKKKA
jgi:hypothetical protein